MTVLIVDDNIGMRETIRDLLESSTTKVLECSDGMEALEAYPKYKPDWVVMDVVMERMDGFTATQKIKHDFPNANIMIITQFDDPGFKEKAKKVGARGFILKDRLMDLNEMIVPITTI